MAVYLFKYSVQFTLFPDMGLNFKTGKYILKPKDSKSNGIIIPPYSQAHLVMNTSFFFLKKDALKKNAHLLFLAEAELKALKYASLFESLHF